jgi:hypothetical protein
VLFFCCFRWYMKLTWVFLKQRIQTGKVVLPLSKQSTFMYLNCNYNRHSFIHVLYSLVHHWYLTSNIYPLRLYCSVYPIFSIICNIQNIPTDALNSNVIGITTIHVSGSLSAHYQEFLAVHRLWYILCSCDDLCYQE